MIPTWPAELPRPERNTWQKTPQEARLKRNSDSGPAGYRRRFSSVAKMVSLSILVDRNGKAIFDRFFDETTSAGATPFTMPDPTTDGWAMQIDDGSLFLADDGTPILLSEQWLCQFGDQQPSEAIVGVEFRLTFSVMVLP